MEHPPYAELERLLDRIDSPFGAAGAHGALCGALSADGDFPEGAWLRELGIEEATRDLTMREARMLCVREAWVTRDQLADENFAFFLLLPDDGTTSINDRIAALAQWCDGYLYGVVLGGLGSGDALGKEGREFLDDVARIANAGGSGHAMEDEEAYVEVVEYLRIGVLLMKEVGQSSPVALDLQ